MNKLISIIFTLIFYQNVNAAIVVFKDGLTSPTHSGSYHGTQDAMLANNSTFGFSSNDQIPPGNQGQNFGARPNMEIGSSGLGQLRHGLIRFDVTELKGHFKAINSIGLRLHTTDTGFLLGRDVEGADTVQLFLLSKANQNWVEGTGVSATNPYTPALGESTWSQRIQSSEDWAGASGASMEGIDYSSAVIAQASFDSSTGSGGALDFKLSDLSLISLMKAWAKGENPGLFLKTLNELPGNRISIATREFENAEFHPELIVDYVPEVPIPGSAYLFISGFLVCSLLMARRKCEL
jgi:hypothetical protein